MWHASSFTRRIQRPCHAISPYDPAQIARVYAQDLGQTNTGSNLALHSPLARSTWDLNCMHKPQGGLAVFLGHVCGPWPPCLRRFVAPHRLFSTRSGRPSSQRTRLCFGWCSDPPSNKRRGVPEARQGNKTSIADAPLLPPNRFDGDRSKPAFVPG